MDDAHPSVESLLGPFVSLSSYCCSGLRKRRQMGQPTHPTMPRLSFVPSFAGNRGDHRLRAFRHHSHSSRTILPTVSLLPPDVPF